MARRAPDSNAKLIEARKQHEEVMRCRIGARMTYAQIADRTGLSIGRIGAIIKKYLQESAKARRDLGDLLLDEEIASMDKLWQESMTVLHTTTDPRVKLGALAMLEKLGTRRQKLFGLEVVRVDITGDLRLEPGEAEAIAAACTDDEARAIDRGDAKVLAQVRTRVRTEKKGNPA